MNSSHPADAGAPGSGGSGPGDGFACALSAWAAGVTLLTIADDRDDIGTTVSAFMPVSLDPPLVAVSLIAGSYPAEVLSRPSLPAARFAVTLLSAAQKVLAGQFAAEGRPSARLILDAVPHVAGRRVRRADPVRRPGRPGVLGRPARPGGRPPAGDLRGRVDVAYVAEAGDPLVRFRGRYPAL